MPFAIGENVGAYRIVEKLGQGGMATVYKAYHPALDRYVAIKVMHPSFTEDPNFLARFQREARIVAKLDHPHIIPIYDFAEHHGQPYLVMRYIEGETLKARIRQESLDPQEVLRIARAVGEALTYAHGEGVLHRDIKPSNVLMTPDGGIYLTDFGLARMAAAGESTLSRDMMVGTPQYISPEQAKGITKLDARTDIYSFGVVLYELLVGQAPFTADTPYAIIHDHIFTPLPLPRELNPDLPELLERILLKALAKEPDDRFQSVQELITALQTALEAAPPPPPPETIVAPPPTVAQPVPVAEGPAEDKPAKRKRRWPWIAAAAAAGVCLIAFFCFAATRGEKMRAQRLLRDARSAAEEGNSEQALELYQQAAEADPNLIPAYAEAGQLLADMGHVDRSIEALTKGLEANPENPQLHTTLAGIALLAKRLDVAEREVQWMLAEMPEQPITHAAAGLLTLAQGEPCGAARPELEAALEMEPESAWARYGLALCLMREGDPDAARAELEFVLGQEDIPPALRFRAEETMRMLDEEPPPEGIEDAIAAEFRDAMELANKIPEEELRSPLKDMLGGARGAWEAGDRERAIQMVKDATTFLREHWDALDEPLARLLNFRLNRIVRLAGEPPP